MGNFLAESTCWELEPILRGHEYHYSELIDAPNWKTVCSKTKKHWQIFAEGFKQGSVYPYIHLHFASRKQSVVYLLFGGK
jgi:cobyrinic acid a,c-diamide synthase